MRVPGPKAMDSPWLPLTVHPAPILLRLLKAPGRATEKFHQCRWIAHVGRVPRCSLSREWWLSGLRGDSLVLCLFPFVNYDLCVGSHWVPRARGVSPLPLMRPRSVTSVELCPVAVPWPLWGASVVEAHLLLGWPASGDGLRVRTLYLLPEELHSELVTSLWLNRRDNRHSHQRPRRSDGPTAWVAPGIVLVRVSVSRFHQRFPEAEEVKRFLLPFHQPCVYPFCVMSIQGVLCFFFLTHFSNGFLVHTFYLTRFFTSSSLMYFTRGIMQISPPSLVFQPVSLTGAFQ